MCIHFTLEKLVILIYNMCMKKIIIAIFTIFILLFVGCAPEEASINVTGMGTVISLKLYGEDCQQVKSSVLDEFDKIDSACSLTKKDSAVNRLNETGKTDDPHILEQVNSIKELPKNSGFDITVGSVTSLWNIGFENAKKPEHSQIEKALLSVGMEKTQIKDGTFILSKDQKIDLGAVTKGYALDKAKEILEKHNVSGAVITVGGSVLFYGENPKNKNWTCAVKDPFDTSKFIGTFSLENGFVSTSGSYERFFSEDGKTYHHIIDARTGYPSESDVVSVTVICENGLLSDALSTISFMAGVEEGTKILEKYDAKGIFIKKDGNITVVGDIEFEKA